MRKIMQVLGMKAVESVEQLSRAFMRSILERLMRKITAGAGDCWLIGLGVYR